ncbi:MAG TPA: hypothetical protein VNG69_16110 [Casimicrobiaceae bacterium]|nr:hypothetical protein [Casimicrobiaceae bacterium]
MIVFTIRASWSNYVTNRMRLVCQRMIKLWRGAVGVTFRDGLKALSVGH